MSKKKEIIAEERGKGKAGRGNKGSGSVYRRGRNYGRRNRGRGRNDFGGNRGRGRNDFLGNRGRGRNDFLGNRGRGRNDFLGNRGRGRNDFLGNRGRGRNVFLGNRGRGKKIRNYGRDKRDYNSNNGGFIKEVEEKIMEAERCSARKGVSIYTDALKMAEEKNISWLEWKIYRGRGFAYKRSNEYELAIEDLKKCGEKSEIYSNIGECFFRLGKYDQALPYFETCVQIEENQDVWLHQHFHDCSRCCRRQKEYEMAIDYLIKAISYVPSIPYRKMLAKKCRYIFEQGKSLEKLERYDDAKERFTYIIEELEPLSIDAHRRRGFVSIKRDDFEEAVKYTKETLEIIKKVEDTSRDGGRYKSLQEKDSVFDQLGQAYMLWYEKTEKEEYRKFAIENYQIANKLLVKEWRKLGTRMKPYRLVALGRSFFVCGYKEKGIRMMIQGIEGSHHLSTLYKQRYYTMMNSDPLKSMDDAVRACSLERGNAEYWNKFITLEKYLKVKKQFEEELTKNGFSTKFYGDTRLDEKHEKDELRNMTQSLTRTFESGYHSQIITHCRIGKGCYGNVYYCHVNGIVGCFAIKFFFYHLNKCSSNRGGKNKKLKEENENAPDMSQDKSYNEIAAFLARKEHIKIPYHRNVAMILCSSENVFMNFESFPDYKEFWKDRVSKFMTDGSKLVPVSFLVSRLRRKNLEKYMVQRKGVFSNLEKCYMLLGLLRGANHLFLNFIANRDIKPDNIFIEEDSGRIWIGDFGCSLDLSERKNWVVHKDDDIIKKISNKNEIDSGGGDFYKPNEVLDFRDSVTDTVNFSKYDVFSIGIIADTLFRGTDHTFTEKNEDSFDPVVSKWTSESASNSVEPKYRSDSNYTSLELSVGCDKDISDLISLMLRCRYEDRISVSDALKKMEVLLLRQELLFGMNEIGKLVKQGEETAKVYKDCVHSLEENVKVIKQKIFEIEKTEGVQSLHFAFKGSSLKESLIETKEKHELMLKQMKLRYYEIGEKLTKYGKKMEEILLRLKSVE